MGLTACVLGASGYSGGELVRLLLGHPALELGGVAAAKRVGETVADVEPNLAGSGPFRLVEVGDALRDNPDVVFSCLPSGALEPHLDAVPDDTVLVDLADDFRSAGAPWTYGLTEFARGDLSGATRIANPGCYPTAALLGLVPFARSGSITVPVVIDALSGVSGAGRRSADHLLHAAVDSSVTAYGTVDHRHRPEIERGLESLGGFAPEVSFTPHLVPMARGLLVTARARLTEEIDDEGALGVLEHAYAREPLIHVVGSWPATKAVRGSNRAHVFACVDHRAGWLIVSVAIDNLGKGAAGQAVQNANVALGIDETVGLEAFGVWP
ncbi:MAG: N-acetyl-gamma-glutamyl-phosphate reductase [Actinomycetota bacterium]